MSSDVVRVFPGGDASEVIVDGRLHHRERSSLRIHRVGFCPRNRSGKSM
ncbi:MAG: hypothetical protein FWD57_04580 [Polyangiaceae bacterium]|nr:hypothetical protein [Polyangiaceae bacterium]